jgi:hypothetical protein
MAGKLWNFNKNPSGVRASREGQLRNLASGAVFMLS